MEKPKAKNHSTAKAVVAGIFGTVSILLFIPMILLVWINLELLNANNFSKSTTAIIISPQVSEKIASSLTDTIVNEDTIGDLSQNVLTPEESKKSPQEVKSRLKEVFNENIIKIMNTASIDNDFTNLIRDIHIQLIEKPSSDETSRTINLRPIITSIINGTKGTRIEIVSKKFTLDDGKGVITLNQDQYKKFENIIGYVRIATALVLIIFIISLGLSISLANSRILVIRRLVIAMGVIMTLLSLLLLLLPIILSSAGSSIAPAISAEKILFGTLSIIILMTGIIFIAAGIIVGIKFSNQKNLEDQKSDDEKNTEKINK